MSLTAGPFPYDIDNLLGGAVRILYAAPDEAEVPANIFDIFDQEYPYEATDPWVDLGATKESFTYTRGFDTEGWEIQQVAGNVIEELTSIERTIEVSVADFSPASLQMIENAPSVDDIPESDDDAVSGERTTAVKRIPFGSFTSVTRYRFAFVSKRSIESGLVIESDARERGRFFVGVANTAQIAADDVDFEQEKGNLSAAGVTFTLFPDPDEDTGEEYGAWLDEQAGEIPTP